MFWKSLARFVRELFVLSHSAPGDSLQAQAEQPVTIPASFQAEFDFEVMIRGGSHPTLNGSTPRRRIQRMLQPGQPLRLQRQPENPADPNAILIYPADGRFEGIDVGFVPRGDAEWLATKIDSGFVYEATVSRVNVYGQHGQFVHAYAGMREVSRPAQMSKAKRKKVAIPV